MRYLSLTFLAATLLFASSIVSAQTIQGLGGAGSGITMGTSPERPGPNQTVTATISSYATDLSRADISWFLNGQMVAKAVGQKSFTFKTGKIGSLSGIVVSITTAEGSNLQQILNIRPASVDLIWESDSYTPPFYRGKALYPYQGRVKIVAVPNFVGDNGVPIKETGLMYAWKGNDKNLPDSSGYGKNFIFWNSGLPLRSADIEVEVTSVDNKYVAKANTTVTPAPPELLLYEDSPIYGVLYNKALRGNAALQNEEIKISGIPYFMDVGEREGSGLSYDWQLNGQNTSVGNKSSSVSFKRGSETSGLAGVGLQVSDPNKIFQFAENALSLSFGSTASTGF